MPPHHSGTRANSGLFLRLAEHPAFRRRLDAASGRADDDAFPKMSYGHRLMIDSVTGVINAIVSLPVMISFAVIIFQVLPRNPLCSLPSLLHECDYALRELRASRDSSIEYEANTLFAWS